MHNQYPENSYATVAEIALYVAEIVPISPWKISLPLRILHKRVSGLLERPIETTLGTDLSGCLITAQSN
jgi:hypothetical protein